MKKLQHVIEFVLAKILTTFIRRIPQPVGLAFGRMLGIIAFYLVPIRKRVAMQNISSCYPEKSKSEIIKILRRCYINFAQTIIEFIRLPFLQKDYFSSHITFVNSHLLKKAYEKGKGGILLSGHFGNWELLGAAIHSQGYTISGIARNQRNRLVNRLINENRNASGLGVIKLGMAIRGVFHALRNNHFIAILADQDARRKGIFIDFFGRPSSTATGPAVFALKFGCPIIFACCVREGKGHHTIYLEEVDYSDLKGVTDENIRILTQRHASLLEKYIRQYPDHWFWMHRRWKTKPRTITH